MLSAAPPPGSFTLTFEDEFNGDTLDGSVWRQGSHDGSVAGYRNSGTGAGIKRENIVVADGMLTMTAQQETATGETIDVGDLNNGAVCVDGRIGTDYLMYSEANVITRFGAYTGNADHIIAVYYANGDWRVDTNFGQAIFTPVASDVLLATVDFTNDTVTSLEGQQGGEYGITYGSPVVILATSRTGGTALRTMVSSA